MMSRIILCAIFAVNLFAQTQDASRSFQISGAVVDALTGQPIAGARLGIAPVSRRQAFTSVMSDADGHFLFHNVLPGKYSLVAAHAKYLSQFFDQHDGFSTAIVVGPGLDTVNLVFRLSPESSISGRISDEAGEPVPNAQITLYRTGTFDGRQATTQYTQSTTDDDGFYRFRNLHPGQYFVVVSATPWYAQHPWPKPRVTPRAESSETRAFTLRERVAVTYADDQETSALDVAYPITFYPGVTDPGAAGVLVLKTGERFIADISLQPVPALHLRLSQNSAPDSKIQFPQLQTRLFGAPLQVPLETHLLEQQVEIVGIPPGHYELEVPDMNQEQGGAFSVAELDAMNSGPLRLDQRTSSVSVSAVITLDPGIALPVQGLLQLSNLKTQETVSEQFSGNGTVEIKRNIRPGNYQVLLNGGGGEFIKALSAVGGTVIGRTVEIKQAGELKLAVTVGRGQGQVVGMALRAGKPVAGAMVLLVPADPAHNQVLFRRDQSDSDGTFTLGAIPPGKYTVLALENAWDLEWSNPAVLKPFLARGALLQVQPNGKYDVKVNAQSIGNPALTPK